MIPVRMIPVRMIPVRMIPVHTTPVRIVAAAALLLASACAPRLSRGDFLDTRELKAQAQGATDDNAHAIVLSHKQRYLFMVWKSDKDTFETQVHRAVLVRTPRGVERHAEVRVPIYRDGELVHLEARTISPDGKVTTVTPKEVFEEEATFRDTDRGKSARVQFRVFRFPRLRPGSIVEYTYTTRAQGIEHAFVEEPAERDPVKRYELELLISRFLRYDLDVYNVPTQVHVSEQGSMKKLQLVLRDIPPLDDDVAFAPDSSWIHPRVVYRNKQVAFRRWVYNLNRSWPDALDWVAYQRYLDEDHHFSGFPLSLSRAACSAPRCLADQALDLAREQAEFSGFTRYPWWTRALKKVVSSGYANNHEKALLVYKLLSDAGVDARLAFTTRRWTIPFDEDTPYAGAFNHTLVHVPVQSGLDEALWLDPSCEPCAAGELPPWSGGQRALVIQGETNAHGPKVTGEFLPIVGPVKGAGQERHRHDAVLSADGTLDVSAVVEELGTDAMWWRREVRAWDGDAHRRQAESDVTERMRTGRLLGFEPSVCDRRLGRCVRSTRYRLPAFATHDDDDLLLPLAVCSISYSGLFFEETRDVDVALKEPREIQDELRVKLPQGYRPSSLPKAQRHSSDAFDFELEAGQEGDVIVVKRLLRFKPGRYPKESCAELRKPVRAFSDVRRQVVVLQKAAHDNDTRDKASRDDDALDDDAPDQAALP